MKTPVCSHKSAVAKLREVILSLKREKPKKSENNRNNRRNSSAEHLTDSCDTRARSVTRVVENNCKAMPRANQRSTKPSLHGDTWSDKLSSENRKPNKRYNYHLKCKKLAKQFKNSILVISKITTLRSINNTIIISTTQRSRVRDVQSPLHVHVQGHGEIEGNNLVTTSSESFSKESVGIDNKIENNNVVSSSTSSSIDNARNSDEIYKEKDRNADLIVSASNTIQISTQNTEHNDSMQVETRVCTIILDEATSAESRSKNADKEQETHQVESKMEIAGKVSIDTSRLNESDEDMFDSLAAVYDDPYVFDESDEEIESYKRKEMSICSNIGQIELGAKKTNINCNKDSSDRGKKSKKYRRILMHGDSKLQTVPVAKSKPAKRNRMWNLKRFIKRPKSSSGGIDGDLKENVEAKKKSLKKRTKSISNAIKDIGKSELTEELPKNFKGMKAKGIRTSAYRVPAEIEMPALHSKGYGSKKTLEVVENTESKGMNSIDRKEPKEFYVTSGTCTDVSKSNTLDKISKVSPTLRRARDQLSQNLAMLSKYSIPVTIEINVKSKYEPDHACRKLIQQTLDHYLPNQRSESERNRAAMVRKPIADISNFDAKPIENTRSTYEDNIKFLKLFRRVEDDDDDNDSVNGTIIPPSVSIYSDSETEIGNNLNGVERKKSNRSCITSIRKDILTKIHNWNINDINF